MKLMAAIPVAEWLNKDASNQAKVQHLSGTNCMVKITPNALNLDHAKK